jgi:hypothetical protein
VRIGELDAGAKVSAETIARLQMRVSVLSRKRCKYINYITHLMAQVKKEVGAPDTK